MNIEEYRENLITQENTFIIEDYKLKNLNVYKI
jgi:hypothetical protein